MASKIALAIQAQEERKKRDEQLSRLETKVEALTQQVTELVAKIEALLAIPATTPAKESTKGKSAK